MTVLRVASYNTRDFKDDVAAAARVVCAIRPDVLCLQEVPRRLFSATRVADFAARCGLYSSDRHLGSGGTTILTSLRVQVVDSRHSRLRVAPLQRTRGYAVAHVAPPGHLPLVVASVHLSLDPAERERHTGEVLRSLAPAERAVVAGDLNEDASGRAWRMLATALRLASPASATFPASQPRTLLDVVFASPSVCVLPHQEVALSQEDLVAASDHLPVWVDVDLPPERS